MNTPLRFIKYTFFSFCLLFVISGCEDDKTITITEPPLTDTSAVPFLASDFSVAETCQSCHPQHYAEWSGSMHAYAVIDPSWQAIRAVGQGQYINALDGACSPCHSPIGLRSGDIEWGPLDMDALEPITREGIGCDACHTITGLSRLSNAGMQLSPSDIKHGTIKDPVSNGFHESQYNDLYASSEYCGSCHDFVTDAGLPLEIVFQEWREAGFAMTGKTCNDCHMETYTGQAAVGGPERTLHRHDFIGADIAMIDFPNKPQQLAKVTEMLQNALTLSVSGDSLADRRFTYYLNVDITNDKTGHNVPSGVPFNRQLWVSVVVRDVVGNIHFSSGQLDANNDLMDRYSEFSERDTNLFNAQATMLKADGSNASVWDVDSLVNPSIKPGETKNLRYGFSVSSVQGTSFTVEVKVRFRSFAPYLFRYLGLDSLLPIPIIDMNIATFEATLY